ncbi:unnamed protein product [Paramecium octaurelia]|uniref:TRAF3-interacting protein 1 N-terminal domain-containing protein n=1 Tax=Paramecium octaurelia TaxID=43137 RepID=A0A8S1YGL6_PAROT|nr:unnamed protein product [Paramecium octaurelia]
MADFWQTTADMFSTLITRPMMKEKYLIKPPFNYIFDIILETRKKTGYAKGLYKSEELDDNYYYIKDRKVFFLQKIIDLTSLTLNEELQAKPNNILEGLEPEQTNVLLQAIYRAAVSGQCNDQHVNQILAGLASDSTSQQKEKDKAIKKCIEQQNIGSIKQTQIKQNIIIDQQQIGIQQLEKKGDIIFKQEQQLEQIKNSDYYPQQAQAIYKQ